MEHPNDPYNDFSFLILTPNDAHNDKYLPLNFLFGIGSGPRITISTYC